MGKLGVDVDAHFSIGCSINGCLFHDQFPPTIFLSDCEGIIIVEDVLGGRDDLGGCLLLLFALSLLAEEIRFGTLATCNSRATILNEIGFRQNTQ